MSPITCPFCDKPSPPGARFCSACGGALYLAPCPNCGAVNDVSAESCYQCRASLPGRKADDAKAFVPASAETKVAGAGARYARIVAAVAALVVLGGLGYFAYHRHPPADPPPAARDNGTGAAPDAALPPAHAQAAANDARPPAVATTPGAPSTSEPAPKAAAAASARAGSPRAAASSPRVDRQTVESPRPKPAAAPSEIPLRDCTPAVAALGLCQVETARTGPARLAPAEKSLATEQADAAPKAPAVAPALPGEPCTAAIAALGLCTPLSKDQGKGE